MSACTSCGMSIESGPYCEYCVDAEGKLQEFDERLARMLQWTARNEPELAPEVAEKNTLEYMATMSAWKDHPELRARIAKLSD